MKKGSLSRRSRSFSRSETGGELRNGCEPIDRMVRRHSKREEARTAAKAKAGEHSGLYCPVGDGERPAKKIPRKLDIPHRTIGSPTTKGKDTNRSGGARP